MPNGDIDFRKRRSCRLADLIGRSGHSPAHRPQLAARSTDCWGRACPARGVITSFELPRSNPRARRTETMIFGAGQFGPFGLGDFVADEARQARFRLAAANGFRCGPEPPFGLLPWSKGRNSRTVN